MGLPLWIGVTFNLVVFTILGIEVDLSATTAWILGSVLCLGYCGLFLWLGRRQIIQLELADAPVGRAAQIPPALVPRQLSAWFRSRPTGAIANLLRKEVCLQKPNFLVSAIFTGVWLLTLLLLLTRPSWKSYCLGTLSALTAVQVVLMTMLTGCVALGDDKALGATAWHLTLPCSARRQWFIKLSVAAATFIGLAVFLPALLAAITPTEGDVLLLRALRSDDLSRLGILAALLFVLSFWSASMVNNAVRAALTCMAALAGIGACIFLGHFVSWWLLTADSNSAMPSRLLMRVLAHFQLPPNYLGLLAEFLAYGTLVTCLLFSFAALFQSLQQFRRLQTKAVTKFKYVLALAAIIIGGSFWSVGRTALQLTPLAIKNEVGIALSALLKESSADNLKITPEELERTGALSNLTKHWLRNSDIRVVKSNSKNPTYPRMLVVNIRFPAGRLYHFSYIEPGDSTPRPTPVDP